MGAAIAWKTGSGASARRLRTHAIRRRARRKSRRILLALAGAFAFVTAAPFSIAALTDSAVPLPGVETARSFLALMNDRSPGRRTSAELTKVKLVQTKPKQRALGKILEPDEVPPAFVEALAPPPELLPMVLAPEVNPIVPAFASLPPGGGFTPPGGGGGGCCGGGGPTPPGPENPPPPPPPPSPVPEPGTWATMLLGFGMIGWILRRQRRRVRPAALSFS